MATRILVADDHLAVREGIRAILETEADFEVVGEAADGVQAVAKALELRPDLIVLDNSMPKMTGLEVARSLHSELPETRIVFLTLDPSIRDAALNSGATSVVLKDAPPRQLLDAIRRAAGRLTKPVSGVVAPARPRPVAVGASRQHVLPISDSRTDVAHSPISQPSERVATRTLIADDHRSVREGVRSILAAERDFEIVGEAEDGVQALALARSLRPDLLVLDNSMPGLTGLEVAVRVVAELPDTAIVLLTLDANVHTQSLAAGAVAHVSKDDPPRELVRAAREAQHRLEARQAVDRLSGDAKAVAEMLLNAHALSAAQLGFALVARLPGESLATCLRRSRLSDPQLTAALAAVAGVDVASLAPREDPASLGQFSEVRRIDPVDHDAARTLPRRFCEARGCVLIECIEAAECTLALADPLDRETPREVEEILAGPRVRVVAATRSDVTDAIERAHALTARSGPAPASRSVSAGRTTAR